MTYNLAAGLAGQQAGMNLVKANNRAWYIGAKATAMSWLAQRIGTDVTGEEITAYVTSQVGDPNPHIWGALTHALLKEGCLKVTGRRVPMTKDMSHARRTDVYNVVQP